MSDASAGELPVERTRRWLLVSGPLAVGAMLALAGCSQVKQEPWQRPDWLKGKRGTNGNGGRDR